MIDLLYTSHNRLEFTMASFDALAANTNWKLVNRLLVVDDDSKDGTYGFLAGAVRSIGCNASLAHGEFGGPVASMNHALDRSTADVLAKIDNDVIVCPGWLDEMSLALEANPGIDALGMEPGFGERFAGGHPAGLRSCAPARWIGGVGLIRTRVFARARPKPDNRFFGWTRFQRERVRAAWITPDLPVFLLDHLPFDPWRSLTAKYVRNGWARSWDHVYPPEWSSYWSWWTKERAKVA